MTRYKRSTIRLLITTAAIGWACSPAFSQTTPGNIADPDLIVDENGVDLLTGKYYAVGARAASQELAYEATWFGAHDASILNSRIVVSGSDVFVSISGKTIKFTKVGTAYVPENDKGGTLERIGPSSGTISTAGFRYTSKASDKADFEDDPVNLAGNAAGTTSARPIFMSFSEPTRPSLLFTHKKVAGGGSTYQRVDRITDGGVWDGEKVVGGAGYNSLDFTYASNVATDPGFKKLTKVETSYAYPLGPPVTCPDSCIRVRLTISNSASGGIETVSMTDKGGEVITVTKGSNGVTAIRSPGDSADGITLTYTGTGEVSTLTSYGRTFTYSFGTSGADRTATVTLTGGGSKYYVIDPTRRILLSKRNEEMETQSFAYDTQNRVTQITYPEGNYISYVYDARANMTQSSRVAKPGSGDVTTSITLGFPAGCTNATITCNQAIWSQDAKGVQTDYVNGAVQDGFSIEEIRLPAATIGGDRMLIKNKYANIFGQIRDGSGIPEPSGVETAELVYVEKYKANLGNFASLTRIVTDAYMFDDNDGSHEILQRYSTKNGRTDTGGSLLLSSPRVRYDGLGNLIESYWIPGAVSSDVYRYYYDVLRRPIGAIGPDVDGAGPMRFSAIRSTYNNRGLLEKVETGTATAQTEAGLNAMTVLRATEHFYDPNRRLERSQIRAGGALVAVTQFSYNALGLVECTAQRMNPAVFSSLPSSACTLGTEGSFGPDRISKNHYDLAGRLLRTEHALGTADAADEITLTYNDNGTVATMTDGQGNRTSFEYDGHDRLKKKIFPHKTASGTSDPSDYEQYWYDANDNLTQKRLRDGQSISFSHDRLNRVTVIDLPGAESDISYTYDIEGRPKSTTRGAITTTISYDAVGRMVSEGNSLGAVKYEYDPANRLTRMTWPDAFYVTYDYHSIGPIKSIKENGATAIATYGYDSFGRQISMTYGSGAIQSYGFDTASRLNTIGHNLAGIANDQTITLTYNPASQIATRTASNDAFAWTGHFNVDRPYTANGLNQFTEAGATVLGYDGRGNLASSGSDSYGYTSDGLLNTGPGGATLSYDGRGTLFETAKSGVTTRFLYAGSALVGEYSGSNVLQRRYVHGPGTDNPLLWYEGTGTTNKRYLMGDERGSITTLSDGTAGLFAINRYDEYGIPAAGNSGRFQYTGQAWVPELGMYHYKARMYSPTLGRFMQTDPIGYGDGMNLYNYVGSDPVNGVDPTGMVEIRDPNDIVITGTPWVPSKEPTNCLSLGGNCISTGRDIADELAYAYAQQQERLKAPPAAVKRCPVPSNVALKGTLYMGAAAFGTGRFSGTLTDVSTGAEYEFRAYAQKTEGGEHDVYNGSGAGFALGSYSVVGTVKGFDALSKGFQLSFAAIGYGFGPKDLIGGGQDWASIKWNGESLGDITVNNSLAPPAAAAMMSFNGVSMKMTKKRQVLGEFSQVSALYVFGHINYNCHYPAGYFISAIYI